MSIFVAFNVFIWISICGLIIYAHFLKNPLSKSKYTTGDMVRSISLLIMAGWCLLVGFAVSVTSIAALIKETVMILVK